MQLDNLNLEILNCLIRNGRLSFREIGKQVGLSSPAVAQRVTKMEEEGIIKGYSVAINHDKIGKSIAAIITLKTFPGQFNAFLKKLPNINGIEECHRLTGNDCVLLKVYFGSTKELESAIDILHQYGEPSTSLILSTPLERGI